MPKIENYAFPFGLCFVRQIMLKNYASILYQCLLQPRSLRVQKSFCGKVNQTNGKKLVRNGLGVPWCSQWLVQRFRERKVAGSIPTIGDFHTIGPCKKAVFACLATDTFRPYLYFDGDQADQASFGE